MGKRKSLIKLTFDNNRLKRLVAASAKHDAASFETLYNEFSGFVYNIARSILHNSSESNDVVQEVFIKIFQLNENSLPKTNAVAWLYTLAKNEALSVIRRRRHELPIHELENELGCESLQETIADDMKMMGALSALGEESREIVVLKAVCGYTHREIASILKIPQGTVQWRYSAAIRLMKELYNEVDGPVDAMTQVEAET